MTIGRGGGQTPNVRATVQEIYEGLEVQSQNRWPSLSMDLMQVNDLASRFLSAGFYYKTFMWPASAWMFYEHWIRRATSIGADVVKLAEAIFDSDDVLYQLRSLYVAASR